MTHHVFELGCHSRTDWGMNLLLMSDLHVGAAECDKGAITRELEWAKANGARVLINGDVFDLILPSDKKRYSPHVLDPELRGTDAVLNGQLEIATKLLRPYAGIIDVIGVGNHESAGVKYHSADICSLLLERLNTDGGRIKHGGYTGTIYYKLGRKTGKGTSVSTLKVWYHHGTGGGAEVTKGTIGFNRIATWVEGADIIWQGHTHHNWNGRREALRLQDCGPNYRSVTEVQTGAYLRGGRGQFDKDGNYQARWAVERRFSPKSIGGAKLAVKISQHGIPIVEVTQFAHSFEAA